MLSARIFITGLGLGMGIQPEFVPKKFMEGALADPVLLCIEFFRAADAKECLANLKNIYVPRDVYFRMLDVHQKALKLLRDIEAVLDDPEHDLILTEARNLGHSLPNKDLFVQELEAYRRAVRDFDVKASRREQRCEFVRIPVETARSLNDLMKYNSFMVARIFDDCFNTDYMKHFKFYKQSGYPYQGPNALQASVDVLISMAKAINQMEKQIEQGRLRGDWPKYVGRPAKVRQGALPNSGETGAQPSL